MWDTSLRQESAGRFRFFVFANMEPKGDAPESPPLEDDEAAARTLLGEMTVCTGLLQPGSLTFPFLFHVHVSQLLPSASA